MRGSLLNDSEVAASDPFSSDIPFLTYHTQEAQLMEFRPVSAGELLGIITCSPVKSGYLDPIPTNLLKKIVTVLLPSLVILVNKSLSSGCFPESFKRASVTQLLKKSSLDPNELSNYRPVSGLPFLSTVIERVVLSRVNHHLSACNLLSANQSAYREHHSTETVLLAVNEVLFRAADTDSCSALLLLDLSAAFDTVEHSILIRRLTVTFGIGGTAIEWFLSYLSGRSQVVRTPSSTSEAVAVRFGVPKGSVLGPVLFLAYVGPLKNIAPPNVWMHQFSDDTQLGTTFHLRKPLDSHPSSLYPYGTVSLDDISPARTNLMHTQSTLSLPRKSLIVA